LNRIIRFSTPKRLPSEGIGLSSGESLEPATSQIFEVKQPLAGTDRRQLFVRTAFESKATLEMPLAHHYRDNARGSAVVEQQFEAKVADLNGLNAKAAAMAGEQ
jgi:hypothetical protein